MYILYLLVKVIVFESFQNSVRHNLSLNKCFAKVESAKPVGTHTRKGCLWALNPAKIVKMEEEIVKWRKKDPESVKFSMAKPGMYKHILLSADDLCKQFEPRFRCRTECLF